MGKHYRFRISYREWKYQSNYPRSMEYRYTSLSEARETYKSILLAAYRQREVDKFELCLNRLRDPSWRNPIHFESVGMP